MVVADARPLPTDSLARTVRDQGLHLTSSLQLINELQQENLELRQEVNDVAESLAALIRAVLPRCPAAAQGGAVPTATTIATAVADAAHEGSFRPGSVPPAASTVKHRAGATISEDRAATAIQARVRGRSSRALPRSARVAARAELTGGGAKQPEDPNLAVIIGEMRDLACSIQLLPTEPELAPRPRPASAPPRQQPAAGGGGGGSASGKVGLYRPPMASVPENQWPLARPQTAPATRRDRDLQTTLTREDKAEARHAVEVAQQSVANANCASSGLPEEHLPARRSAVHGGPQPASAGSSRRSKWSDASDEEFERGAVRPESQEAWLRRQPGGAAGHLSYVKARTHNPKALTKQSDKQALADKTREAKLADPPVRWIAKTEVGWGDWKVIGDKVDSDPEPHENRGWEDAIQVSHTQGENNGMAVGVGGRQQQQQTAVHRSRPQSAPARSSSAQAARQQQRCGGRSAKGQGSAGRRPASASVRSIPPIYREEDDEDSDHYETVSEDEAGEGYGSRSEWKSEQRKWSKLAKGALQSMEEDAELTDLALMVRQMESDPAAAATILGEAAVAAADAAIVAQESEEKTSSRTFSSVAPGKGKVGSNSAGSLGRRGWGQYAAEKRRRAARRRGGSRSKKAGSGSEQDDPAAGVADEAEGGVAAGEDELADYYDWLLSVQQGEEATAKVMATPKQKQHTKKRQA